jgi:hypothetical protein
MMNLRMVGWLLAWMCCAPVPTLGGVPICPNEMEVKLPKEIEIPPGWERMLAADNKNVNKDANKEVNKHILKQVELYDGHPDFYPEVRPQNRQATQTHWEFRLMPNSKLPVRAVWVKCKYGEQLFNLLRPLPTHFKICDLNCDNACQLVCK